jgi:hypothetical protein
MNKELILKYKKEFDYWVNGGKILMHYGNKWLPVALDAKWEFFVSDLEEMRSFGYVIADEYVKFRKALAEGKTIQCNAREEQNDITYAAFGHNWWIDTTEFIYATRFYRIKPKESQFKVGDWVHIPSLNGNPCQFSEDLCMLGLEKWEPQADEVHWFSRNKDEEPVLGKFVETEHWRNTTTYKICTSPEANWTCSYFEYCEPFIGTLPTKWRNK